VVVKEIDGHNLTEIVDTLDLVNNLYGDGKPKCIIAHTVKGYGIPVWEKVHMHYGRAEGMTIALKEGREYMAKYNKYVQLGPPTANAAADEVAMVKVLEKYKNVVAVLEM